MLAMPKRQNPLGRSLPQLRGGPVPKNPSDLDGASVTRIAPAI